MQPGPKQLQMAHAREHRNKKYTICGAEGNVKELAEHFGVKYSTVRTRLLLEWSLEKALTTPTRHLTTLQRSKEYPGRIFKVEGILVKRCAKCLEDKRLEDFGIRRSSADELEPCCETCTRERRTNVVKRKGLPHAVNAPLPRH